MAKRTESVVELLDRLNHPRRQEIDRVRSIIAAAVPGATERVKWNAPSFVVDGTDRLTLRLQPGSRVQLVFHRGSKPSAQDGVTFEDPSGLLEWAAADRGVITFASAQDVEEKAEELSRLVERWAAVPVEPQRDAVTDTEHPEGEST